MASDAQVTATGRLKRSCLYAIGVVVASTACVFLLLQLEPKAAGLSAGTGFFDIAAYVLGFPLFLGWIISTGIFGPLGSCATPTQMLGVFLTPVISIVVDTGLLFGVWEFIHRRASRGALESENILHINR
jgi:ABC-type uncharacterized transport system permease subunit